MAARPSRPRSSLNWPDADTLLAVLSADDWVFGAERVDLDWPDARALCRCALRRLMSLYDQ